MSRGLRLVLVSALLMLAYLLPAQSNEQIDAILSEEVATVGSAAYVALTASEIINDDTDPVLAVTVAKEAGWLDPEKDADMAASFGDMAFLMMQAMEVNGGVMYRIFPGPRYAAREFVSQGWSPENRPPSSSMSGQFLIRVAGNFLEMTEATR